MDINKCILCGNFQATNLFEFHYHLKLIHGVVTSKQIYVAIVYIHFITNEELNNIQSTVSERIDGFNKKYCNKNNAKPVHKSHNHEPQKSVSYIETRKELEKILQDSDDDDDYDKKENVRSIKMKLSEELESSDEEDNSDNDNLTQNKEIEIDNDIEEQYLKWKKQDQYLQWKNGVGSPVVRLKKINVTEEMLDEIIPEGSTDNNFKAPVDITKINLAEKFKSLHQCKLCFAKFEGTLTLKRHEDIVHIEDQKELEVTFFTLEDLIHPCKLCPGVKFLTENILNGHMKLQHRVNKSTKGSNKTNCKICKKAFLSGKIIAHKNRHNGFEVECKLCYRLFKSQKSVQEHHVQVHATEGEYQVFQEIKEDDKTVSCTSCELKFVNQICMKYHARIIHSVKQLQCLFCDMKFNNGVDRNTHCLKEHGKQDEPMGDNKLKCMLCGKVVIKKMIAHHRLSHINSKKIECTLCHLKFKYWQTLEKHVKTFHMSEDEQNYLKHGKGEFTFECKKCSFKFLNEKLLEYHQTMFLCKKLMKEHNMKNDKLIPKSEVKVCKLCFKKFETESRYNSHMRTSHKGERHLFFEDTSLLEANFSCEVCSLKFLTENSLRAHITGHKFAMKCFYCNFEAENRDSFDSHCQSEHGKADKIFENKRIQCMFCNKIVRRNEILIHRRTHFHTKNNSCKLCYSKSKSKKALYLHVKKIHKSEEERNFLLNGSKEMLKFKCDYVKCNLMFLNENLKQRHLKGHLLLETYCILCHFKLKSNTALKEHRIKYHSSEAEKATFQLIEVEKSDLKFTCIFCDKMFMNISHLKYHRKYKHKSENKNSNRSVSCEFCNKTYKTYNGNKMNLVKHIQSIHNIPDYNIDEYAYHKKVDDNNASRNFLNVLDSLGK